MCAFSELRMPPESRQTSISESPIRSTSSTLKSSAMGQNTRSAIAARSSTRSSRSSRATSQPPQPAAQ